MGEIIYWKKYDEPIKYVSPINGKEYEREGEYVCNDERVEKFAVWGFLKDAQPSTEMGIAAGLFMKDGSRPEFTPIVNEADKWHDDLISQAEQYLKELK